MQLGEFKDPFPRLEARLERRLLWSSLPFKPFHCPNYQSPHYLLVWFDSNFCHVKLPDLLCTSQYFVYFGALTGPAQRPVRALSEVEQLILAHLEGRGKALCSRLVEEARSIVRLKGARFVGDEQVRIFSTKIDGIGPRKAIQDEPADPNIIYEEPDDEASSSDKDVSDATLLTRRTLCIMIFLASSVRRDKREMLSISQKSITICSSNGPLLSLYWSYSYCAPCEHVWIREGNRSYVPLTQVGNGSYGTATWGMSAYHRKANFSLWVIKRAALSGKGRGTRVLVLSRCEEPRRLGDRLAIGVLRDINQGNKSGAYDDAFRFHFVEVPSRGKGCR
ncbi:hypothetical protein HAX54_042582 [Datura stramonium]|uniref:Uncharacterized protein n=1 Tax=Datura stramonium TaxID=4076 RepID=A0ABS8VZN7_DATST|nr:hypothetical protein [Datura stramonium]